MVLPLLLTVAGINNKLTIETNTVSEGRFVQQSASRRHAQRQTDHLTNFIQATIKDKQIAMDINMTEPAIYR